MKKFLMMLAFSLFFAVMPMVANAQTTASWTSPEGIVFETDSDKFGVSDLKALRDILLENATGEELYALKKVRLLKGSNATRSSSGLVTGSEAGLYFPSDNSISLFDADGQSSITAFKVDLTHEYGHHFSYYWLAKAGLSSPPYTSSSSEWASVRSLQSLPVRWPNAGLSYEWKYEPQEIMAEDYGAIFGSKTVMKQSVALEGAANSGSFWQKLSGVKPRAVSFSKSALISGSVKTESGKTTFRLVFSEPFAGSTPELVLMLNNDAEKRGASISAKPEIKRDNGNVVFDYAVDFAKIEAIAKMTRLENVPLSIHSRFCKDDTGQCTESRDYNFSQTSLKAVPNPNRPADGISVFIDNIEQSYEQPPVIVEGVTLVPMRALFEKLGAAIEWNGDTYTVTAKKGGKTAIVSIGSRKAYANGKEVELEQEARLINERTMIPLRFASETLGFKVDWNGDTRSIYIASKQ